MVSAQVCYAITDISQNKEGILPVATLSIALYVLRRFMSDKECCARGGNFVIGFINTNKYTSASENVHLCLKMTRQLGHISVATGRIHSLFCGYMMLEATSDLLCFCHSKKFSVAAC